MSEEIKYIGIISGGGNVIPSPASENRHNYSTNEQIVGTWIDGKPLYEKTYSVTTPNAVTGKVTDIDLDALGVDNIISITGYVDASNNNRYMLKQYTYYNSTGYSSGAFWRRGEGINEIDLCIDSPLRNRPAVIIIQYTKTMD